ncbi:MAG TPA: TetR/AcrR family transcriptional regulator [Acetobacteraceae bacterium]|nr:TetR/AcrR family transcriptional regulator [Acetobacteraceae bacterium]
MRAALVDAAEALIRTAGYPAVSARSLAEKLGLKRQIVHYYFHTMDDVFVAVIRQNAERFRARVEEAMRSAEPLRALQVLNRDPAQAILAVELNALANHHPAVRAEVARTAEELRALQTRVLATHLAQRGETPGMPPIVATILLTSLAQILALEASIDVSSGHAETLEFVDDCLRAFADGRVTPFTTTVGTVQRAGRRRKAAAPG